MYWTQFNFQKSSKEEAQVVMQNTRTTLVTVLKNVLDPNLHKALKTYARALKTSREVELKYDTLWGGRWIKNNDPFVSMLHDMLTPVAYSRLKIPIKPSYNFLSCYEKGGVVPLHTDRPQCKYTLDYMIEQSEGLKWELFVCDEPVILEENDAVIYSGTDMPHYRNPIPDGHHASLVFFHFVDSVFNTDLD